MRNPRRSPARGSSDVARPLDARKTHQVFLRGAKTLLFKGEREAGNAPTATSQRDAAPAAHRTSPCVATDVCTRVRTLHALLMRARRIKCFCEGAKTLLFKGKKAPPSRSKAHSARPTRCGFSREPARYDSTHPFNSPAHSAPKILLSVGRACPRPPQAGYARNARIAPKQKAFGRIRAPREQFQ